LQDNFQMFDSKSLLPSRKGRDRRVFLFELYIVFAKETKPDSSSFDSRSTSSSTASLASTNSSGSCGSRSRYAYKSKMLTAEIGITEHVDSDESKFAIWSHGHDSRGQSTSSVQENKIILKCNSLDTKLLWVRKMREVCFLRIALNKVLMRMFCFRR